MRERWGYIKQSHPSTAFLDLVNQLICYVLPCQHRIAPARIGQHVGRVATSTRRVEEPLLLLFFCFSSSRFIVISTAVTVIAIISIAVTVIATIITWRGGGLLGGTVRARLVWPIFVGRLAGWPAGRARWLPGPLARWLAGLLAGWLASWLTTASPLSLWGCVGWAGGLLVVEI